MIHNSFLKKRGQALQSDSGQVMLLTVLVLSGSILGATTIAGLLMLNQLRQATNVGLSLQALFAADTGVEWELFKLFKSEIVADNPELEPTMGNRTCIVASTDESGIKSVGCAGGSPSIICGSATTCPRPVNRAFEIFLEEQ